MKKVILYDALANELVILWVGNFIGKWKKNTQVNYPLQVRYQHVIQQYLLKGEYIIDIYGILFWKLSSLVTDVLMWNFQFFSNICYKQHPNTDASALSLKYLFHQFFYQDLWPAVQAKIKGTLMQIWKSQYKSHKYFLWLT